MGNKITLYRVDGSIIEESDTLAFLDLVIKNKAYLSRAYLSGAYLSGVNLSGANLSGAYLSGANLSGAYLSGAYLSGANLSGAYLSGVNLSGAYLSGVNLSGAYLSGANLSGVNLSGANLSGVNLSGANNIPESVIYENRISPVGAFTAYKKALVDTENVLIELLIPKNAKRSNGISRKCRASEAKIISITGITTKEKYKTAYSIYNSNFKYNIGKKVVPLEPFDENPFMECGSGIHYFITKEEAINYNS